MAATPESISAEQVDPMVLLRALVADALHARRISTREGLEAMKVLDQQDTNSQTEEG